MEKINRIIQNANDLNDILDKNDQSRLKERKKSMELADSSQNWQLP